MADMKRMVPRVIEAHEWMDIFTMAHLVTSAPRPLDKVDAIAIMPGLGEYARIQAAVKAWEANTRARFLLVSGTNGIEKTQIQPTLALLQGQPFNLHRLEGVVTQVSAEHTPGQAEWIIRQVQELAITSMALFVSNWHLPRAYGTLIKTSLNHNNGKPLIPIYPIPVSIPPSTIVPEIGATTVTMSAGEAERILKYQKKGDVTTFPELVEYLDWLWQQPDSATETTTYTPQRFPS